MDEHTRTRIKTQLDALKTKYTRLFDTCSKFVISGGPEQQQRIDDVEAFLAPIIDDLCAIAQVGDPPNWTNDKRTLLLNLKGVIDKYKNCLEVTASADAAPNGLSGIVGKAVKDMSFLIMNLMTQQFTEQTENEKCFVDRFESGGNEVIKYTRVVGEGRRVKQTVIVCPTRYLHLIRIHKQTLYLVKHNLGTSQPTKVTQFLKLIGKEANAITLQQSGSDELQDMKKMVYEEEAEEFATHPEFKVIPLI